MALSSVGAFAQYDAGDFTIQPKVGLSVADYANLKDSKTRAGVVAGAEFEYHVSPLVGISAGLQYSMQGCKFQGTAEGLSGKVTFKNDYLNIPILANVYVVEGLAIKAGIQPGFKVSSELSAEVFGDRANEKFDKDVFKSFDFSIPVGISYEYMSFILDARYNWGLTKVTDDFNWKNSVFQISLGYKFKL